jgi:hypothetical protein
LPQCPLLILRSYAFPHHPNRQVGMEPAVK